MSPSHLQAAYQTESESETPSVAWRSPRALQQLRVLVEAHGVQQGSVAVIPIGMRRSAALLGIGIGTWRANLERVAGVVVCRAPLTVDLTALAEAESVSGGRPTLRLAPALSNPKITVSSFGADERRAVAGGALRTSTGTPRGAGVLSDPGDSPLQISGSVLDHEVLSAVRVLARAITNEPSSSSMFAAAIVGLIEVHDGTRMERSDPSTVRAALPNVRPNARASARELRRTRVPRAVLQKRERRKILLLSSHPVVVPSARGVATDIPSSSRDTARVTPTRAARVGLALEPSARSGANSRATQHVGEDDRARVRRALSELRGGVDALDDRGMSALVEYSCEQLRAAVRRVNANPTIRRPLGFLVDQAHRRAGMIFEPDAPGRERTGAGEGDSESETEKETSLPTLSVPEWALREVQEMGEQRRGELEQSWRQTLASRVVLRNGVCDASELQQHLASHLSRR